MVNWTWFAAHKNNVYRHTRKYEQIVGSAHFWRIQRNRNLIKKKKEKRKKEEKIFGCFRLNVLYFQILNFVFNGVNQS